MRARGERNGTIQRIILLSWTYLGLPAYVRTMRCIARISDGQPIIRNTCICKTSPVCACVCVGCVHGACIRMQRKKRKKKIAARSSTAAASARERSKTVSRHRKSCCCCCCCWPLPSDRRRLRQEFKDIRRTIFDCANGTHYGGGVYYFLFSYSPHVAAVVFFLHNDIVVIIMCSLS